jgi:hypothetical protein
MFSEHPHGGYTTELCEGPCCKPHTGRTLETEEVAPASKVKQVVDGAEPNVIDAREASDAGSESSPWGDEENTNFTSKQTDVPVAKSPPAALFSLPHVQEPRGTEYASFGSGITTHSNFQSYTFGNTQYGDTITLDENPYDGFAYPVSPHPTTVEESESAPPDSSGKRRRSRDGFLQEQFQPEARAKTTKKQRTSMQPDQDPNEAAVRRIYKDLRHNEMRYALLAGGRPRDPIQISFEILVMDRPTEYEALSYVWGMQQDVEPIHILHDGKAIQYSVTKNLASALKHLRYNSESRLLWIDALCINQRDEQEKSRQVSKMDQIFLGASNVCIWLGDPTSDSSAAMEFISQILDFSVHSKSISKKVISRSLALSKLLARPWFSRRWVVQEMALARKATVHCGTKSILWSHFADAVALFGIIRGQVVKQMSPDEVFELGEIHAVGAASLVDISSNIYRKDHINGQILQRLLNLETLLAKLAMFNVTQAHDAIYATIALGRDSFNNPAIPVDYSMSAAKLFALVTEIIIKTSGSLDIICRPWAPSGPGHESLSLPSWIPTVASHPYKRRNDGQYNRHNADFLVGRPEHKHKPYSASEDISANVTVIFEDEIILISGGIRADDIAEVGDLCVNGNIPTGWKKMAGWNDSSDPVPPEFWRTLVADRGPDSENPPNWYERACQYVFRKSGTDDLDTTKMISALLSTDVKDFLLRVQSVTWGRKFFLTKHLPQPGIGPADCRVGDYICTLYGCSVPLVLRRLESKTGPHERYRLIGECYVQGMMGGEAVKWCRESPAALIMSFHLI